MAAPDAKTRNKIALNPHRIRSSAIPTHLLPQIFLSNVLFALSLHAGQEWLLRHDVGIFWVTLRVLAFGGLAVLIKEAFTGELANKKSIEASPTGMFIIFKLSNNSVVSTGNVFFTTTGSASQSVHDTVQASFHKVISPSDCRFSLSYALAELYYSPIFLVYGPPRS